MERKAPPQHQKSNKDTTAVSHNTIGRTDGTSHFYLQDNRPNSVLQKQQSGEPAVSQAASGNPGNANRAGLPDQLKAGIEGLSRFSMDDVKVHYNSDKPAQLNALAYAQGTSIHLAPGQEKHLSHEAWHVVQQKQGRVRPTLQMKAIADFNADSGLEKEADVMGAKAMQHSNERSIANNAAFERPLLSKASSNIIQYVIGPGGMLHSGRRVKGPGNVIYRIIGTEQFLGKLNYRLKDEDGNELIRPFDDPAFNLVPLGEQTDRLPLSDDRDRALHNEDDEEDGYDSSEERSSGHSSTDGYSSDDEEEAGSHDEEENDDEEQLPDVASDKEIEVEEPYTPKTWTVKEMYAKLAESTVEKPLRRAEIEDIKKAVEDKSLNASRHEKLSRDETKKLNAAIAKAEKDIIDHAEMDYAPDANEKKRTKTKKGDKKPPSTFGNEIDSESSDEEYDPDARLKSYALSMSGVSNRSHVPGLDEIDRPFRNMVTGLPHADTYLALFKNGQLVPRNVNGTSNAGGIRKRMRDVEAKIKPELKRRDELMLELDTLTKGKKPTKKKTRAEREKIKEIRAYLADKIRPHVEAILFGSSIRPVAEDNVEAGKLRDPKSEIKKSLRGEENPSAASEVLTRRPPGKLSSGKGSHTHAEQALISTRTWISLINKLVKQIGSNKDQPEKLSKLSFNTLQLVLNRSTCVGCARELMVELIRFWQTIAGLTAKNKDWRAAKQRYEGYVNFLLDFPAIYEVDEEKNTKYVNLQRIILGLRDAGWTVRITTGIKTGEKSDAKNARMRKFAEGVSSTPMFYVQGWDPKIVCFAPTGNLKGLKSVLVNGIAYILTKDGQYLSVTGEAGKPSSVDSYKFVPTGMPNALKGKKRIGGGGPPGDSSDSSSSSDHSSSDHSSDEDESSSGSSTEEEYSSDPESDTFDTGRIMHAQNTCYLSALIHLFASHARLSNLFRPGRDIPLEDGPDQNLLIRQADREKGEAIQMASRVGEAILELRNPRGVVTKKTMGDIMTFLGLIGGIIDVRAPVATTKTPKPKELDGKATVMSAEMIEKDRKANAEKSIKVSKSLRRDKFREKMVFTKKVRPASWGVQQDAAEVLVKILSYLQPDNHLKIHMQSRLGPNADAGFAGGITSIQESTLQLPIGRNIHTIQDALTKFSAEEQINDFKHGGGDITVAKQVKFTSMPTVLTIVLKRFSFNMFGVGEKITKPVIAPTLLTIPAACLAGDLEGEVIRYRLVHFVQHTGGYGGGHYLSHVKNMSDEWHKHDDIGGKRTMHDDDTFEKAKNESYIYVYEKVNRFYHE